MGSVAQQRILFLGMQGIFSLMALRSLLAATPEIGEVVGVVVAGESGGREVERLRWSPPAGSLPLLQPSTVNPTVIQLAWQQDIPVYSVGMLHAATQLLSELRPDIICVACFPQRIPTSWLSYPTKGCLNIHPSLLPKYRGPTPIFWQQRMNESLLGVTVHFINEQMDAGDIVAQQVVAIDPDSSTAELESQLAEVGGNLLAQALKEKEIPRRPQNEALATTHSFPTPASKWLKPNWTVEHAMRFINGANEWGPMMMLLGEQVLEVHSASMPNLGQKLEALFAPSGNGELTVQFKDGTLTLKAVLLGEQKS